MEEAETSSVVHCQAQDFCGGLQIASIVVTAATPVAPSPDHDPFREEPVEEEEEPPMPPPPAPEEDATVTVVKAPVPLAAEEEDAAAKSDDSLDTADSVDSQLQRKTRPRDDVQIVIDPPREPAREDQFEGIDVTQEIPVPESPRSVTVTVQEPKDGGDGVVDPKPVFPPPKMMDDSLEDEEEKKLPEELLPDQLKKLEHIQESNA